MDQSDMYLLTDSRDYSYENEKNDSTTYGITTYVVLTKEMYNNVVNNINFNFLLILFTFGFLSSLICCSIKEKYVILKTADVIEGKLIKK